MNLIKIAGSEYFTGLELMGRSLASLMLI